MDGSSRSLIRELNTAFDYWGTSQEQDKLQNLQTSDLFKTIRAFHERHNTLPAIIQSTNIHNELYNFYNHHINPSNNLPSEILFLEILTELLPVLNGDEIELWLKTYLRPAVDSANFDNQFIKWCRNFIDKVTCRYPMTDDPDLVNRRETIAMKVMNYVLRLYLGDDDEVYHFINLRVADHEKTSQEYSERTRFITSNCLNLLQNFALEHSKLFGDLVNQSFISTKTRSKSLALIAHVVNSKSSKISGIADSDLFTNMYKCLVFDFNEKILQACISTMVMLIPLVSSKVSQYISEFFIIYTRLAVWEEFAKFIPDRIKSLQNTLINSDETWDLAGPEEGYDIYGLNYKTRLNAGHLVTIMYGFFPYSLVSFSQDPQTFLDKYKPKIVDSNLLVLINLAKDQVGPKDKSALDYIKTITVNYLKSFRLHPNFLLPERLSTEYERNNPIQWIIDETTDGSALGVEEIVISCLSLNPLLAFHIPENISTLMFDSDSLPVGSPLKSSLVASVDRANQGGHTTDGPRSRTSSLGSPLNFTADHSQYLANAFDRKLSIVPTNLFIDSSKRNSEVSFKELNFDKNFDKSYEESSAISHNDPGNGSNDVKELFSAHERLYNPKLNDDLEVTNLLSEKRLKNQPSLASVDTSKETVFSQSSFISASQDPKKVQGSIVDYYQRELLLAKNEIEFSSYMKHLNKFQYVKLRLKLDTWLKDQNQCKFRYDQLLIDHKELINSYGDLKRQFENLTNEVQLEKTQLMGQFLMAQTERNKLEEALNVNKIKQQQVEQQLNDLINGITKKDEEIIDLKNELKVMNKEYNLVIKQLEQEKINDISNATDIIDESHEVEAHEREIYKLKSDNLVNLETIENLQKELKEVKLSFESTNKTFEHKLSSNKNEVDYQLNTFNNQNEKKIQELSAILLKYENLIEEKNLRIAQLSSSKPISIPGSSISSEVSRPIQNMHSQTSPLPQQRSRYLSDNPMDFYELNNRQRSNSSGDSIGNQVPYNTPPLQTAMMKNYPLMVSSGSGLSSGQSTPPIIKGRGGYQKRSKKHM